MRAAVVRLVEGVEPDKRFVYYLMGATGIVVVPLTGFQSTHHGFRATLLETDDEKRAHATSWSKEMRAVAQVNPFVLSFVSSGYRDVLSD